MSRPSAPSGRSVSRRAALASLGLPILSACGFRPVYGRRDGAAAGSAADGLAQIAVGLIPERAGQLLRLALQQRFEGAGGGVARRYDLTVTFAITQESIGIQADSSATRTRFIGQAQYWLTAQDPTRATLTSGSARAVDGLDVFNQQFFAADQEAEVVQRRIAEAVADQIALQLAVFFDKRAAAAAG